MRLVRNKNNYFMNSTRGENLYGLDVVILKNINKFPHLVIRNLCALHDFTGRYYLFYNEV